MSDHKLMAHLPRRKWIITSPIYAIVPRFVDYLQSRRYARDTIYSYLASLAHFAHWLSKHCFGIGDINDGLVEEFVHTHLPSCRCPRPCMDHVATNHASLQHLLSILKLENLICVAEPQTPIDAELELYRGYLVDICGCAQTTCNARLGLVRRMLSAVFGNAPVTFVQLTPEKLGNFITHCSKDRKPATCRANCVCITSYLRFSALQGNETKALLAAIPHMAPPMPGRLPVTMSDSELTTFFSAFDLTTPIGMRDFAIGRCMADLALRRKEVLMLNIESINWREGTLTLSHNKSQRERILPLPVQTAEAIVRYLKEGRPVTSNRAIFVRHIAPFDDPLGVGAINNLIGRALVRGGLNHRLHGTHLFRRSAATRMVQGGVSLKEIADTLGHKNLNTTKIYTRVDLNRLRSMAQAWPGSPS